MYIQNLASFFEIEYFETDHCPIKPHKHSFVEVVYILSGKGIYQIGANKYSFEKGDLFIVNPDELNFTIIDSTANFLFIRFNKIFLDDQKATSRGSKLNDWTKKIEYIFNNRQHTLIKENVDKLLLRTICEAIVREHSNPSHDDQSVLQLLVNTLLVIVSNAISQTVPDAGDMNDENFHNIIHYIHKNIYSPEKLKQKSISSYFNISPNYLSEYFKKHTEQNLREYINNYKLSLIETRLKHSNTQLNEIAFDFGFADVSHFSKFFKNYKGLSPANFRKKLKENMNGISTANQRAI